MKKHCTLFLLFIATILNVTVSNKIYATKLYTNYIFKINDLENSLSVNFINSLNNLPHPFNKVKSFILKPLNNDKDDDVKHWNKKKSILLLDFLDLVNDTNYLFNDTTRKEIETQAVIQLKAKPVGVNDVRVLNAEEARNTSSVTLNILANDNLIDKLPVTFETLETPLNVKDLVVNLTNGEITFILPDSIKLPSYYTYTYRLKTLDGVYSNPISATVYTAFSPSITLNKTPNFNDINNDGLAQAGETITYTFSTKNTGNVDIENAIVNDLKIGLKTPALPNLLKPAETGTITVVPKKYVITAADVLAGKVSNTATVTALEPITNTVVTDTSSAIVIFPILKIELIKSSIIIDLNGNCIVDEGDKVQYIFTVTNKGTVDVFSILINDLKINLVNQPISPLTLAPGKSGTLTALNTYTITQADIINGFVSNKAFAQGKNLQNTLVTAEAQNLITVGKLIQNCPDGGGGGGGGGGGMYATARGVFEITPKRTRFIPIFGLKELIVSVVAGFVLGQVAVSGLTRKQPCGR